MSTSIVRRHVWLSGRVQGVGYRWSTRQQAQLLGVSGWIRNLPDGRVEAVFEGTAEAVTTLLNWCKTGPPSAVVQDLEVIENEPLEEIQNFNVS